MKIKNIFIVCVILSVIFINPVFALTPCEMSGEYKNWLSLSEEERKIYNPVPYCKEAYEKKTVIDSMQKESKLLNKVSLWNNLNKASISQTRYDSRDYGYVMAPKDQMHTNSCWAYTANSLVSTSAIKEGLEPYNLSERHVEYAVTKDGFTDGVNNKGFNRPLGNGGNSYMSSSYYMRHDGPVSMSDMPFVDNEDKVSISMIQGKKTLLDIGKYTNVYTATGSSCTSSQIADIKQKILDYGSVGISIYYSSSYLSNGVYYYYPNGGGTNHAVTIVGWDDSISSSSFKYSPGVNGAWIVKNSWGTDWGDNGYFYVSYGDKIACSNIYTFSDVQLNTYTNVYNSSNVMANFIGYADGNTFYSSAKFTKKSGSTEYLDKISFEVSNGVNYRAYLTFNSNLSVTSDWIDLGTGLSTDQGIYSLKFNPIAINSNYTIIVKYFKTTNLRIPYACKTTEPKDMNYNLNIPGGVNYYSTDTVNWYDYKNDAATAYNGCASVIYAYTRTGSATAGTFNITGIKGSATPVYSNSDDYYEVSVTSSNILSYEMFDFNITNSGGVDVSSTFKITANIPNGKVFIYPTATTAAGTFTFNLKYNGVKKTINFTISSYLSSDAYQIKDGMIIVKPTTSKELTKSEFTSHINTYGFTYKFEDSLGVDITSNTDYIGTGMKLVVNGHKFPIVLIGDVSGDGKIRSNDALIIRRHIVSLQTLENEYFIAGEISGDKKIMSNDSLLVARYVVGLQSKL